ncbi:MAG: hypothetical protein A3A51_05150 [Candidatus Levybacteria bacterium RIFCSPLOWO2_01_FULL_39_10]|nr:MAG: hypothetical protein A3A51_05150 [Candidatus Levybacteria bacterium RIFCSPLOWO2_01_FULL_39_10]
MQKKDNFLPFFVTFFILCFVLILIGKSGIINSATSYLGFSATPLRSTLFTFLGFSNIQNSEIDNLITENRKLRRQIVERQDLARENEDLKNQIGVSDSSPTTLIFAKVIGMPSFVPGESSPDYLIIGKGEKADVVIGDVVVLENNIVGRVTDVSKNYSRVRLSISDDKSHPVKILRDEAEIPGIIKGTGDAFILQNIPLSEKISQGDIVVTKGDLEGKVLGYPPNLIIGKITSIEKESQELFQQANVESFVDFAALTNVFIIK